MHPITHGLIGWLMSQPLEKRRDRALVTASALVPDLDGLSLLSSVEDYERWHHTFGHNAFFGLALAAASFAWTRSRKTAIFVFAGFHTHIAGDLLGSGSDWPIPYFWPASDWMLASVPPLQWNLSSWQSFVITAIAMALTVRMALVRERTIMEVVNAKADQQVVETIRRRFKRAS